jgi:sialidase-1
VINRVSEFICKNKKLILLRNTYAKVRIVVIFLSVFFSFNLISSQKYNTAIPINGNIVTVRDWLVAKPMPSKYYKNAQQKNGMQDSFSKDFLKAIGGETTPTVIPNKKFNTPDGNGSSFFEQSWKSEYIDLTELFGEPSDVFTYLFAELESDGDQDVYVHIGTNDAGKVWINGKLVIEHKTGRAAEPSQNIAPIHLKKGNNTILLKIDQFGGGWGAYCQIYGLKDQKLFDTKIDRLYAQSSKNATIIETKVICKEEDRYIGWPTITKTKSGELVAVFSGNRDEHVCPYGITQMIRSKDNGKTWTDPITINNTPLDDRDAGILETNKGTWVVTWFTSMVFDNDRSYLQHPEYKRHREKLNEDTVNYWLGNWTRRSLDNGKTWEEPVKQLVTAPHGPIELKDGRLLYVGTTTINNEKKLAVEESKNDGITWNLLATIDIPDDESIDPYSEPHVVELSNGKLVAMFRYQPSDRSKSFLRQTESLDGGKTWTVTKKTNIWGYPPHLLKLKNDWLLLSYGVRKIPYGERACISKDGGKTWDIENEIILSLSDSGDLGYPASTQLDDGSIITIYYQIDKSGEKTSLMQTHWKLNKNK